MSSVSWLSNHVYDLSLLASHAVGDYYNQQQKPCEMCFMVMSIEGTGIGYMYMSTALLSYVASNGQMCQLDPRKTQPQK